MDAETLKANAASLAEMPDPPNGIIDSLTEAAAKIEQLKAELDDIRHDYTRASADAKRTIEQLEAERDKAQSHARLYQAECDGQREYANSLQAQLATLRTELLSTRQYVEAAGRGFTDKSMAGAIKSELDRIDKALATNAGKEAADVLAAAEALDEPHLDGTQIMERVRAVRQAVRACRKEGRDDG